MASDTTNLAPDFIKFLFSNKPKFDCYFKVGNISQGKPKRIGAVKLMLMAHSEVFRLELEDSELKDKENVPIPDIHPDTFKGMLKYVYGHDTTSDMSFDDADNLLYVAEKYMMKTLKNKLATRLMKLLNTDNICSLLNNPACYTHLELDSAITDILRYETDQILASPQFLCMNADCFLKILQQDELAVAEIDLWRAAIKWAKHRANTEDGKQLRRQLCGLTKHLRICTLTLDEVVTEVVPTDVLTGDETVAVIKSLGKNAKPQGLSEFSDKIQPRRTLGEKKRQDCGVNEVALSVIAEVPDLIKNNKVYEITLQTKQHSIELLPLVCQYDPQMYSAYKICRTLNISKISNHQTGQHQTPPPPWYHGFGQVTGSLSNNCPERYSETCYITVKYWEEFEIPLTVDGREVTLQPNTLYSISITLRGSHLMSVSREKGFYNNDHLSLSLRKCYEGFCFPSNKLQYRVVNQV